MRVRNILILLAVLAVLGGIYLIVNRPETEEPTPAKEYLWKVDMEDIQHIEISLPRDGLSQSFIKIAEGDWRFDDEEQSPINPDRWGSGPQLLVSGPAADRVLTDNATDAQLEEWGLSEPSMIITLTLADDTTMIIDVGDSTPNGINYYVKAPGANGVGLVDYTWHDVLSGLVLDPPYATEE